MLLFRRKEMPRIEKIQRLLWPLAPKQPLFRSRQDARRLGLSFHSTKYIPNFIPNLIKPFWRVINRKKGYLRNEYRTVPRTPTPVSSPRPASLWTGRSTISNTALPPASTASRPSSRSPFDSHSAISSGLSGTASSRIVPSSSPPWLRVPSNSMGPPHPSFPVRSAVHSRLY